MARIINADKMPQPEIGSNSSITMVGSNPGPRGPTQTSFAAQVELDARSQVGWQLPLLAHEALALTRCPETSDTELAFEDMSGLDRGTGREQTALMRRLPSLE